MASVSPESPGFCSRHGCLYTPNPAPGRETDVSADADYARVVRSVRNELGKFIRVQDSGEDFQTVYNPGTWA